MIEKIGTRLFAVTPRPLRRILRRLKYAAMARMPQARYWNLAALISPTAAILTDCADERDFFESATPLVELTRKLDLLGPRVRVIDIGCGIGRYEQAICHAVESVLGVDVSSRMVELARKKVQEDNVRFQLVDGCSLTGVPSTQFHLCFSCYVFQHMPRSAVASYFLEVARVLHQGGHFLFQIPTVGGPTYRRALQNGLPGEPPPQHPFGVRCYSIEEMTDLLRKAGLELVNRYDEEGRGTPANASDDPEYEYFLAQKLT